MGNLTLGKQLAANIAADLEEAKEEQEQECLAVSDFFNFARGYFTKLVQNGCTADDVCIIIRSERSNGDAFDHMLVSKALGIYNGDRSMGFLVEDSPHYPAWKMFSDWADAEELMPQWSYSCFEDDDGYLVSSIEFSVVPAITD